MIELVNKIRRKWMKSRLQPIRVFCLHHVCAEFDAESMCEIDWTQIDEFKSKVQKIQKHGVEFISLSDAYYHICKDWFRRKKYVVLTFDDGYVSIKEILPWLEERGIPVTLFINGKYLDGKSYRKNPKEQYLTKEELFALTSPMIEIGSHGWEHVRATRQTEAEFSESIEKNVAMLSKHQRYIPFHAYAYGDHNDALDAILRQNSLMPVLIDGAKNYNNHTCVHRELL